MKLLNLSQDYKRMTELSAEDKRLFRSMFRGLPVDTLAESLYIVPVDLFTTLTCTGFLIKRYQLLYSNHCLYLVFLPVAVKNSCISKPFISVYSVMQNNARIPYYTYLQRVQNVPIVEHIPLVGTLITT